MKKFYLLVFCMFFMIISCEKEGIVIDNKEPEIDHFLEVGYIEGVNKFILEHLRERDRKVKTEKLVKLFKKHKKVREDIEKIGYVSWKNLIRWQGEDDDNMLIVIPIIKENSTLCEGFALVSYLPNDHLRYGFVSRAQIPSLPKEDDLPLNSVYSQEFAIMLISLCDTELFGGADCNLVKSLPQNLEKDQLQQRTEHCSVYIDLSNCVCSDGGYAIQGSGCSYWVCTGNPLEVYCPIPTYNGGTGGSGTGGNTGGTGNGSGGSSGSGGMTVAEVEARGMIVNHYNMAKAAGIEGLVMIEHMILQALFYGQNNRQPTYLEKAQLYIQAYWNVINNNKHEFLDVAGFVPLFGEAADLINGVLYTIEGDPVNAGLSFAAIAPFVGWSATGGKYVAMAVKNSSGKVVNLLVKKGSDGLITFGGSLRSAIGLLPGDLRQAHHLIPESLYNHPLIQQIGNAAQNGANFFHMNHPKNGIPVAAWRNQPNHNIYNARVYQILDGILQKNISSSQKKQRVVDFQNYLAALVANNPNLHMNNLNIVFNP